MSGEEKQFNELMSTFTTEAVKTVTNAFNEGFLLGVKHAKKVFGEEANNENKN